jgi:hypothetical protein
MSEGLNMHDIALRIAAAALAVGIVFGSLFLWIGVPVLGMWIAGQLTTSNVGFLFATLGGIPVTMVATGFLIYRLNGLYEDVRPGERRTPSGRSAWNVSLSEERAGDRRARAPRPLVDVAMTASAVTALVLLLVWFFFLAEMKLAPMA